MHNGLMKIFGRIDAIEMTQLADKTLYAEVNSMLQIKDENLLLTFLEIILKYCSYIYLRTC